MEGKQWRGGVIYVTQDGKIEKVVGADGRVIEGEAEPEKTNKQGLIFFDDHERCIYGSNGNCYCT